jgi:rhamnosyltransferase
VPVATPPAVGPSPAAPAIVASVVVTYDPDPDRFARLLAATLPQVDCIVVVDNGSPATTLAWLRSMTGPRLTLVELGRNAGIAAAQNVGIARARQGVCDHILLLDHDSVPAPSMVGCLVAAIERLPPGTRRIAAVGPRYLDERQNNPPPFIRVRGLRVTRCQCLRDDDVVEVDYLIASGSLIPVATLDEVGTMAEDLFIDYVDIEWGLRARRRGFQSYGVCAAKMEHDLGETPIRFLGRSLPLHSPLRHYYHFRNAVWLYLNADVPLHWKCADAWRLVLKYGFYSLFARPRLEHFRLMSRGILDGLRGRLGAFGNTLKHIPRRKQ